MKQLAQIAQGNASANHAMESEIEVHANCHDESTDHDDAHWVFFSDSLLLEREGHSTSYITFFDGSHRH